MIAFRFAKQNYRCPGDCGFPREFGFIQKNLVRPAVDFGVARSVEKFLVFFTCQFDGLRVEVIYCRVRYYLG